jgi:transposase InsO family protein
MNTDVLPTFETHNARSALSFATPARLLRSSRPASYELFLQLEEIDHRTTRVKRPQSNGIAERLHRTLLDEHFRVEGRKTWFETIEEMQAVLDDYLVIYNTKRTHQGRGMNGRSPASAFVQACQHPNPKRGRKPYPIISPNNSPPEP